MCPSGGTQHVSFELCILKGLGRREGAPLVRYLCKTHRSLHSRHVWETLKNRVQIRCGGRSSEGVRPGWKSMGSEFLSSTGADRKRTEYCFESTVSEKRTHWAPLSFTANSVSCAKKLGEHTHNRLSGTHRALSLSPELGEGQKTHWARCLKPHSPKPHSARFRAGVWRKAPERVSRLQLCTG